MRVETEVKCLEIDKSGTSLHPIMRLEDSLQFNELCVVRNTVM